MGISRRDFLTRVGQAGGYSAAYVAMQSLGLMPMAGAQWKPIEAAPGSGKGVRSWFWGVARPAWSQPMS